MPAFYSLLVAHKTPHESYKAFIEWEIAGAPLPPELQAGPCVFFLTRFMDQWSEIY